MKIDVVCPGFAKDGSYVPAKKIAENYRLDLSRCHLIWRDEDRRKLPKLYPEAVSFVFYSVRKSNQ